MRMRGGKDDTEACGLSSYKDEDDFDENRVQAEIRSSV